MAGREHADGVGENAPRKGALRCSPSCVEWETELAEPSNRSHNHMRRGHWAKAHEASGVQDVNEPDASVEEHWDLAGWREVAVAE